ncbi:MAG: flippase-like domain-containing protein [Candidatus Pacebacteria bacterium]|nr:flippase-like domain-containing protein [Candidatus Paceibacterota bacterium]
MHQTVAKRVIGYIRPHWKVIQWLCAAVAIYYAAKLLFGSRQSLEELLTLEPARLGILWLLVLAYYACHAFRYLMVLRTVSKTRLSFFRWFRIFMVGRFANNILPQAGNAYRAIVLKSEIKLSFTKYIHVFALFSWLDTLLNLIIALMVIVIVTPTLHVGGINATPAVSVIIVILIVTPILVQWTLKRCHLTSRGGALLQAKVTGIFHALTTYGRRPKLVGNVSLWGIILFALTMVIFKIIFSALGIPIAAGQVALFIVVIRVTNLVMITPGNLGVRELLFGALAHTLKLGTAEGILACALLRVANYMVLIPLGVAFGGWKLFGNAQKQQSDIITKGA